MCNIPVRFPRATIHPPYIKANNLSVGVLVSHSRKWRHVDPLPDQPPLQVNSIALSPTSSHLFVGGPDGYCGVIPVGPGARTEDMIRFKGHVGDVLDVQWFPSGQVSGRLLLAEAEGI